MPPASNPPLAGATHTASGKDLVKSVGLFAALAALVVVLVMPAPQGLPAAGQVMLAMLLVVFSLTYWPWMGYMTNTV